MCYAECLAHSNHMMAGLCHFVFPSFRGEKTPREKTKRRHAKRRHAKRRKDAMRKDEKTPREKTPCEKTKSRHTGPWVHRTCNRKRKEKII